MPEWLPNCKRNVNRLKKTAYEYAHAPLRYCRLSEKLHFTPPYVNIFNRIDAAAPGAAAVQASVCPVRKPSSGQALAAFVSLAYQSPAVEVLEVEVEAGYAVSVGVSDWDGTEVIVPDGELMEVY